MHVRRRRRCSWTTCDKRTTSPSESCAETRCSYPSFGPCRAASRNGPFGWNFSLLEGREDAGGGQTVGGGKFTSERICFPVDACTTRRSQQSSTRRTSLLESNCRPNIATKYSDHTSYLSGPPILRQRALQSLFLVYGLLVRGGLGEPILLLLGLT